MMCHWKNVQIGQAVATELNLSLKWLLGSEILD
jgi:hypothetical protein